MEIDKYGFKILDKGYREDIKRNEKLIRAEIDKDPRFNDIKTEENNLQKRIHAGQTPRGMEYTKEKVILDTEKSILNETHRFQSEKEKFFRERMGERTKELETQIFGSQGKREQIRQAIEKMDHMRSEEARKKAENVKVQFEKANTFKENLEEKAINSFKNNLVERNNMEKITAAYKNVAEGKSISPINFEKKHVGKSMDGL